MSQLTPTIEFNKPYFLAGQDVEGKVSLNTQKDAKVRKIVIKFVARTLNAWEDKGSKMKVTEGNHHLKAEEKYLEMEHLVWTPENEENVFPNGEYEWQFSFQLPKVCMPSFESRFGHTRYFVEVEIDVPNWLDTVTAKAVTVYPTHEQTQLDDPVRVQSVEKMFCCNFINFKQGNANFTIDIPKSGYLNGEVIAVNGFVENHSRKELTELKIALIRRVAYRRDESKSVIKRKDGKVDSKLVDDVISEISVPVSILIGQSKEFRTEIPIPCLAPSFETKYLDNSYFIRVSAAASNFRSAAAYAPFVIRLSSLSSAVYRNVAPPKWDTVVGGVENTQSWTRNMKEKFVPIYPVYSNLPVFRL